MPSFPFLYRMCPLLEEVSQNAFEEVVIAAGMRSNASKCESHKDFCDTLFRQELVEHFNPMPGPTLAEKQAVSHEITHWFDFDQTER